MLKSYNPQRLLSCAVILPGLMTLVILEMQQVLDTCVSEEMLSIKPVLGETAYYSISTQEPEESLKTFR